jgi:hypothetical protein
VSPRLTTTGGAVGASSSDSSSTGAFLGGPFSLSLIALRIIFFSVATGADFLESASRILSVAAICASLRGFFCFGFVSNSTLSSNSSFSELIVYIVGGDIFAKLNNKCQTISDDIA